MANPNLYEDNKGKITKESGGSGTISTYNFEKLAEESTEEVEYGIIHGATIEELTNNICFLKYLDNVSDIFSFLYGYYYINSTEYGETLGLAKLTDVEAPYDYFLIVDNYLDGVKVMVV